MMRLLVDTEVFQDSSRKHKRKLGALRQFKGSITDQFYPINGPIT